MRQKRWTDLSMGQKTAVVMFLMVDLALLLTAVWDLRHRSAEELRGDRRLWSGLVLIDIFGPIAYFTIGRKSFGETLSRCCSGERMLCCGSGSGANTESDL
jgi:hypothetical protein